MPSKGKGKGGGRHKRNTPTNSIKGISKPSIRRLARRGGVKRISAQVYPDAKGVLRQFVDSVVYYALLYKNAFGRKTVSLKDVVLALKRRGSILVGAEQHAVKKRKAKKAKKTKAGKKL